MPRTNLNPLMYIADGEDILVFSKTDAGSYSETLPAGKYRIEISGAGGSGGASASTHRSSYNWANNGAAGERIETIINTPGVTISGIVGQGGRASYAYAHKGIPLGTVTATLGAGGTGYANGGQGSRATYQGSQPNIDVGAAAGGAGGGSTSLEINQTTTVAKGGNGGSCRGYTVSAQSGGTGGSGGVSSGTGAAGGGGAYYRNDGGYSGAGKDGYIKVWQTF